jgi:hypothetical protein
MIMETYPTTIGRPPATVNSYRVLAWAELRHLTGNYPGGVVLCASSNGQYVTWIAYTKDGGQTWSATTGHYIDDDHDRAWQDFAQRCDDNHLAQAR